MKIKLLCLIMIVLLLPAHVLAASVNIATGSQTQDFDLFDVKSAGLPSTLIIHYESLRSYNSPLGEKWTHTFDMYLHDGGYGSLVQKDIHGRKYLFELKDEKYLPQTGDYATLVKGKNGGFSIERDNLTYHYDKNRQLTAIADQSGAMTTFDVTGDKLMRMVTSEKKAITFAYGNGGKLTRIKNPSGVTYSFDYDDGGHLAAINYPDKTAWRFINDDKGFIVTKTEPQRTVVNYLYDSKHRMISSVTQGGKSYTYSYPDSAEPVKTATHTDDGDVTEVSYDTRTGTPTKTVDPKGGVTTYTYDAAKNITSETDPASRTTSYTYDNKNRMTSSRDPYGNVTTLKYDTKGNRIETTDPVQGTVRSEYDAKGQLTKTIGPDGKTVTYVYDAEGNLISLIKPDGEKVELPRDE